MLDIKRQAIGAGLGIAFAILLYSVIVFFALDLFKAWIFLTVVNVALLWYRGDLSVQSVLKNSGVILLFSTCLRWVHGLGAKGYFLAIAIIVAYILWTRWKQYQEVLHHIETMIWGQPLHMFREQGLRPPKIKLGSRSDSQVQNQNHEQQDGWSSDGNNGNHASSPKQDSGNASQETINDKNLGQVVGEPEGKDDKELSKQDKIAKKEAISHGSPKTSS